MYDVHSYSCMATGAIAALLLYAYFSLNSQVKSASSPTARHTKFITIEIVYLYNNLLYSTTDNEHESGLKLVGIIVP